MCVCVCVCVCVCKCVAYVHGIINFVRRAVKCTCHPLTQGTTLKITEGGILHMHKANPSSNENCQYNDREQSLFSYLAPHEGGSSD